MKFFLYIISVNNFSVNHILNSLSTNSTKWSNTLKKFLSVFECVLPFYGMGLKGVTNQNDMVLFSQKKSAVEKNYITF